MIQQGNVRATREHENYLKTSRFDPFLYKSYISLLHNFESVWRILYTDAGATAMVLVWIRFIDSNDLIL